MRGQRSYTRRAPRTGRVAWLYQRATARSQCPIRDHLAALTHEPSFRQVVGPAVFTAKLFKDLGNQAA